MTFDETMKLWFPLGFEDYDGNLSEHHLKAAWNAALDAVDPLLDRLADLGGDIQWHTLDEELKKLKTK